MDVLQTFILFSLWLIVITTRRPLHSVSHVIMSQLLVTVQLSLMIICYLSVTGKSLFILAFCNCNSSSMLILRKFITFSTVQFNKVFSYHHM